MSTSTSISIPPHNSDVMSPPQTTDQYLVYYELHVADHTYIVHGLVTAKSVSEALNQMPEGVNGQGFTLQKKGCLGRFTPQLYHYLKSVGGGITLP